MSQRSYEKLRKNHRYNLDGRYAEITGKAEHHKPKCDRTDACQSTGSHQTGCPVLLATLKRMKNR